MKPMTIVLGALLCAGFATAASAQQTTGKDKVDTNKVQTVDDWAKRKGATEVWINSPQAPRTQPATTRSTAPTATTGAEPVTRVARNDAPAKPKHAKKTKKKIRPHAPPVQSPADAQ